jgi:cyclic pyranopterin phosphate synthase
MVDVGDKPVTTRSAVAEGSIRMSPDAFALLQGGSAPKGNVTLTAELAGTMAAKRTADLIPLCHPVPLDQVQVASELDPTLPGVRIRARARTEGRTGVEMEALTGVAVALLTVYDMLKSVDRAMEIGGIRLIEKTGGIHGDWQRDPPSSLTQETR